MLTRLSIDCCHAVPSPRRGHLNLGGANRRGDRIEVTGDYFEWNGRPWIPCMGEFQFSRYPEAYWEEELRKMKAGGLDVVATYVFWIHHEEEEGRFDWSGRRDLRRFVQLCAKHGLKVAVRVGPFCHGEARNGGLPDWLYGRSFTVRSNDDGYLFYVRRYFQQLGEQVRGLCFKDDGPIVLLQLENEFMQSVAPWRVPYRELEQFTPAGSGGVEHMLTLKRLANEAGIETPLYTVTGWGQSPIPEGEFLAVWGAYAYWTWELSLQQPPTDSYLFEERHAPTQRLTLPAPFACCELGGGVPDYYVNRPLLKPEYVYAMSLVYLGRNMNLCGYYVYHGGSNPDSHCGLLNDVGTPRVSYDFQAPIREFGQLADSYGWLRRLLLFLREFGPLLAPMKTRLPPGGSDIKPDDPKTLRWAVRHHGDRGFALFNNCQDHVAMQCQDGVRVEVGLSGGQRLSLPHRETGFRLQPGQAAMFPFNLDLDGLGLRSATAQPITRIQAEDGAAHYFFFAPDGIVPEYVFRRDGLARFELTQAAVVSETAEVAVVNATPGTGALINATLADGRQVRITTLTDEQSRVFWQAELGGRQRVFLSSAGLLFDDDQVAAYQLGSPELSVAVYPPPANGLQVAGREIMAETDGLFARYRCGVDGKSIRIDVSALAPGKVEVRLPPDAFEDVGDLFLEIDFEGDVGSAFLDGRLVADRFNNGTPWVIGLKRFAPRILESGLVLCVSPTREGGDTRVEFTSMAAMQAKAGQGKAEIRRIGISPEYRVDILAGTSR